MLFERKISKNVLCSNCGFLGWITHWPEEDSTRDWQSECYPHVRRRFQIGEFKGKEEHYESSGIDYLSCYRLQWTLTLGPENRDRNLLPPNAIRQSRQCRYYVKYNPGYTPAEHKELLREAKTRRSLILATLIGAAAAIIAGLAATIIAGLLV